VIIRFAIVLVGLVSLAACHGSSSDGPCQCTPANVSKTKRVDEASPIDSAGLLALLRRHRDLAAQNIQRRDIKMVDDEIRIATTSFCQPCGEWVGDRMTVDEMFPLKRLDEATGAVCLGLVLRDGTTAFGDGRPDACRH
jgi:hypothetical protein